MSGPVKRYRLDAPAHHMTEDPSGYWIGRDDYDTLARELAEARAECEPSDAMLRAWWGLDVPQGSLFKSDIMRHWRALLGAVIAEQEGK